MSITNTIVYAFSKDEKVDIAEEILARRCMTSVQGLNEFANVARRKLGMSWEEVVDASASVRALCSTIAVMDLDTHLDGLRLAERYQLSLFDACMVASALRLGCEIFWSEDLQHGFVID